MFDFKREYRTVRTRNIEYSLEQMEQMRLNKVYNVVSDPDYFDMTFISNICNDAGKRGKCNLVEIVEKGKKLLKASVLVFEDTWSRNMYALMHWNLYESTGQVTDILN